MKKQLVFMGITAVFGLSGCGGGEESGQKTTESTEESSHAGMHHSGSGEVPDGLQTAEKPNFEPGSHALIQADHMEGMDGAEATIVGAYDTTAYTITYTPTTGGEPVKEHEWVIKEEVQAGAGESVEPGTKVTVKADHMEGMDGAEAVIDSAEQTTVYMVDYTPTTGGEKVTNHQWLTENELAVK
jgi:hypothetical protein